MMDATSTSIRETVQQLQPLDHIEREHQRRTLDWIDAGAPLFRVAGPDQPPMHLVTYFPVIDEREQAILLVDHLKSGLWLPPGGHVETGEDPAMTVEREVIEELGRVAHYTRWQGRRPLFLTVTETRGIGAHTDVTLWYILAGRVDEPLRFDRREFGGCAWTSFHDLPHLDSERLDPHMSRFMRKLHLARCGLWR
jgi:8-oxo-dGTP pyrophosphatase MutT (NUDIX family)